MVHHKKLNVACTYDGWGGWDTFLAVVINDRLKNSNNIFSFYYNIL